MKYIIYILCIVTLSLTACSRETPKTSLVGNWYSKQEEVGYCEVYFNDSLFSSHSEKTGYLHPTKYYLKKDSMYIKDEYLDKPYGCRILKLNGDTLLLELMDQQIIKKELWIRLPKDEFGRFDVGTPSEEADSLSLKTIMNFDRRRHKFHSLETNDLREYDSLLEANHWKWNTKTQKRIMDEMLQRIGDGLDELKRDQHKN